MSKVNGRKMTMDGTNRMSPEEFEANLIAEREANVLSSLQKLAEEQLLLERYKLQRDTIYDVLEASSPGFQEYLQMKASVKVAETVIASLKDEIRVEAIKGYDVNNEERNKKPYDGIVIKDYKKIDYNTVQAVTWAKENMPVALKTILDKSTFEKFAKSNPEEESLSFVEFRIEPMATISQDLSQYLPREDENENQIA